MKRVTVRLLALSLALATVVAAGCSRLPLGGLIPSVIEPNIAPSSAEKGTTVADRSFSFETRRVSLQVPLDAAVYAGSKTAQKSAIFIGGSKPANWVASYYRAFVAEKHQEAFYATLLGALHSVRDSEKLDSSRYVELVCSMAQELRYQVDPGSLAPKFPIETFGDGYGDCDDKTLLAAALLSRDGYDVSILLFAPEKHVAMGIRAPGLDYKQTGYAYVEMTQPSLVGIPPESLADGTKLTSQPEVIKIGSGEKAFGAADQITYIQKRLAEVRAAETDLRKRVASLNSELQAKQSELDAERSALAGIHDRTQLIAATNAFNSHVAAYNASVAEVNRLADRFNALVRIERFVAQNQTARPQVYEQLRSARL